MKSSAKACLAIVGALLILQVGVMPPAVAVPYVGLMPNHLAQNVMPEPIAALERVLTSPTLQAGWFADSFWRQCRWRRSSKLFGGFGLV
ncbi:MAG: hypothetical protein HC886_06295 [Leptolyngbyaceae cyanobacterium SM1_1_3]|nr:hypothetical protein [Leptolyngbyaceae cyanobacterium SM1_1_3]